MALQPSVGRGPARRGMSQQRLDGLCRLFSIRRHLKVDPVETERLALESRSFSPEERAEDRPETSGRGASIVWHESFSAVAR